jgi:dephospho-CoA kinase
MSKLIGILGRKRVGKDTSADYLVNNYNCTKIAIATPIKDATKILFNLIDEDVYENKDIVNEKWSVPPRKLIKWLGTDIFRKAINDILPDSKDNHWINLAMDKYNEINGNVVISDVRFQNCIDVIHNNGGIIIKIINDSVAKDADEDHIDGLCGDYYIMNDGSIEDLYKKLDDVIFML